MAEPKPPAAPTRLIEVIGDGELPLADVLAKVTPETVAQAWAAGDIEFGHRKYCTTGREGSPKRTLIIENGMDWGDPKMPRTHKPFAKFDDSDTAVPTVATYYRGDLPRIEAKDPTDPTGREKILVMPEAKREEALKILALQVRLSDKGAAKMAVA